MTSVTDIRWIALVSASVVAGCLGIAAIVLVLAGHSEAGLLCGMASNVFGSVIAAIPSPAHGGRSRSDIGRGDSP